MDRPFDFGIVCGGTARVGSYLLDADTPAPTFPLADPPVAVPGESSGYVSLGLPKQDDGSYVDACADADMGIVILEPSGASTLVFPDDLTEQLRPTGTA